MEIRQAGPEDRALVVRMRLLFLSDHQGGGRLADDFVADTRTFVDEAVGDGTLLTWLAEEDGTCIGAVSMLVQRVPPHPDFRRPREGYLLNMYVDPGRRHGGIGRRLLDACLAEAEARHLRRVYLHTTAAGLPLYERAGFEVDVRWMHRRLGDAAAATPA